MANFHKGKFFLLYLLFIFAFSPNDKILVSSIQPEHDRVPYHEPSETESEGEVKFGQQDLLLHKLEELVRNLSDIVTKLESKFSETSKVSSLDEKRNLESLRIALEEKDKIKRRKYDDEKLIKEFKEEDRIRDGERARSVSVTKYSPFWSERFQFVSAVKLESDPTCINILPFRDYEGHSKYVAVGDDKGRVFVFLRNGDVSVEFYTMSELPVTAMVSYVSVYKNESVLVTGHENGVILIHKVYEKPNGEDWSSLVIENVGKYVATENGEEGLSVTLLEVHHIGRMRYILSADASGKIRVFKENGMVHGTAAMLSSKPLVFLKQRLLFLTECGAGSLDLRTMKLRETECEGLNNSLVRNYVFDATERSKAYGYTSEGDLIHVLLLGDVTNFKCRVRSKRKFDMSEPLAFQAIKGYLLVVCEEKIFVYNVSAQHYVRSGGPRLLFSAGLDEIRSSFLNYQVMDVDVDDEKRRSVPLIASDRDKLLVLGLGGGYVGMYRSNLPVFKGESSVMSWTSPVFFFILFLFGVWHFFAKKKEALTSWGPDDPFSSTTAATGAPIGSGAGERPFVDSSSRNADIMELRSGGMRGPSRRYASPSQYPGGTTSSFRPGSADTNARPPVDPNFRSASELKFRGSTLEPAGFPKRSLYVNNQVVDDSN